MIYLELYFIFFKIGLFSFGGGLPMLSLIEEELILREWITKADFLDLVSIAQITPGAIAINSATYAGNKVIGFTGGIIATAGVVTPSIVIILIISEVLLKFKESVYKDVLFLGIKPITVALIAYAGWIISSGTFVSESFIDFGTVSIGIFIFILFLKTNFNPIYIFILSGILGIVVL